MHWPFSHIEPAEHFIVAHLSIHIFSLHISHGLHFKQPLETRVDP